MYVNFVPELFLEVAELTRFKESLDSEGFRKALLFNSAKFGLIQSTNDPSFLNGKVEQDVDNALNQKTIKIAYVNAIDDNGQFIKSEAINNLPVPSDNSWYWVKVSHQYSSIERGQVTLDGSGNLTGTNTEFLKVLRSNQNFPTFIKFANSSSNTLEYEVVDVTDDNHAVIAHPAVSVGGQADFYQETDMKYEIVGTFTEGVEIPAQNKKPFRYDSANINLIPELTFNTRPSFVQGQEFYLARVKVDGGVLIIQDKRVEFWETKGSHLSKSIDKSLSNLVVGVESVKWQNIYNTGDRNIVEMAWGMRSTNWSIDSSKNIVTFFGSSKGGNFKTTDDFTNGDFNGWRLYAKNGEYSKITSSVKQGSAINLYLDNLNIDNFSTDGGETFTGAELFVCPDADEIEFSFISKSSIQNVNDKFTFPINTPIGKCMPTVYEDTDCKYVVLFRLKSFKEFSQWTPIGSGEYFTEASFDGNGILKPTEDRIVYSYTSSSEEPFIQLQLSPNSFKSFKTTVYKGDIIGVETIDAFTPGQVMNVKVGINKKYQHIVGNIDLSDDIYISLSREKAVEGNEFLFHFDCASLSLGDRKIIFCDNYSSGTLTVLKEFTMADVYQMKNIDNGVSLQFTFDNQGKWICYQNYELGQPYQVTMFDGDVSEYFDSQLQGKKKGYFGWEIFQVMTGRMPIGYGAYSEKGLTTEYAMGSTGGEKDHKLIINELPKFTPKIPASPHRDLTGEGWLLQNNKGTAYVDAPQIGGDMPHNNMSPYRVVAFVKRKY